MKKHNKILLTLLAITLILSTSITVFAIDEGQPNNEEQKTSCTINKIEANYGLTYDFDFDLNGKSNKAKITIRANDGEFQILSIEEGLLSFNDNGEEVFTSSGSVQHAEGYQNIVGKKVVGSTSGSKNISQSFNILSLANYQVKEQDKSQAIRVVLKLLTKDPECPDFTASIYVDLVDFQDTTPDLVNNKFYNNEICQNVRNKNLSAIEKEDKYQKMIDNSYDYINDIPYCNKTQVYYNYDEDTLRTLVRAVIVKHYLARLDAIANNSQDTTFDRLFELSKERAKKSFSSNYFENFRDVSQLKATLQCSYKRISADDAKYDAVKNPNGYTEEEIKLYNNQRPTETLEVQFKGSNDKTTRTYTYTNRDSFYASQKSSELATYVRNVEGRRQQSTTVKACERICEEAVDVEYGPPQGTAAGLCFEYQVKVTSRVKCSSKASLELPKVDNAYCLAVPYCTHAYGAARSQAGPNDEFEACIDECDGGKYTPSCSNKCYKKVYENSDKEKLSSSDLASVEKLATKKFTFPTTAQGYYTRENNRIVWKSTGTIQNYGQATFASSYGYGTYNLWYYKNNNYAKTKSDDISSRVEGTNNGRFIADSYGFKRRYYNGVCSGNCTNTGCGTDSYLNGDNYTDSGKGTPAIVSDYNANLKAYISAVEECTKAATCTTKTANFTMTAKYKDEENKEITITYPLSNAPEKLVSSPEANLEIKDKIVPTGTVIQFDGCYSKGTANKWYQTTWTFPGTWTSNKYGEISYKEQPSDTWAKADFKFCLPLKVQDVNIQWAKWYEAKRNTPSGSEASYTEIRYKENCEAYPENVTFDKIPEPEVSNNIVAETKQDKDDVGFGYFGWDFTVNCFYGLYSGDKNKNECLASPSNYTTKTINNEDLFPSKDGTTTSDPASGNVGREPGFNWQDTATIQPKTSNTGNNDNYVVNPRNLIKKIQKAGNSIYDTDKEDEYLDYQFKLTPSDLKLIKKYSDNNKSNYSDWQGEFTYNDSLNMYIYKSGLFRDNKNLASTGAVLKLGYLGCNNQSDKSHCDLSELDSFNK